MKTQLDSLSLMQVIEQSPRNLVFFCEKNSYSKISSLLMQKLQDNQHYKYKIKVLTELCMNSRSPSGKKTVPAVGAIWKNPGLETIKFRKLLNGWTFKRPTRFIARTPFKWIRPL